MKKLFAVITLLALLAALLAGCAQTPAEESAKPTESAEIPVEAAPAETEPTESAPAETEAAPVEEAPPTPTLPLTEETATYTYWAGLAPDLAAYNLTDLNENSVFKELEKRTNVHLECTLVSAAAETEQFNLLIASGDLTDIIGPSGDYTGGLDKAVNDEVFIDLKDYMTEFAPNYMGYVQSEPDGLKRVSTSEGRMVAFHSFRSTASKDMVGMGVRQDWLDELNLQSPKTYDQLYDVLNAFKTEKDCPAPIWLASSGLQDRLAMGFGVPAGDPYYQIDGKVMYSYTQDGFKDYLTLMNKWYSEGLISKDFVSGSNFKPMDYSEILGGGLGVWICHYMEIPMLLKQAADDAFRVTGISDPVLTEGETIHFGATPTKIEGGSWAVTTACENVELIVRWIDYLYSDDGYLLTNYGVEGEGFEFDGNGDPQYTDLIINNPDGLAYGIAKCFYCFSGMIGVPYVTDTAYDTSVLTEDQRQAQDAWTDNHDASQSLPTTMSFNESETEEYNAVYADIDTYVTEMVTKFIMGYEPLDSFGDFVTEIEGLNLSRCLELKQAACDRAMAE